MADADFTLESFNAATAKADEIIEAAEHAETECEAAAGIPDFYYTPLTPSWLGGSQTNAEARELVKNLRDWAMEALPPHHEIHRALKDVESLFVTVWTEIDEALGGLSMFRHVLEKRAPDMLVPRPDDGCYIRKDGTRETGLETATMYLHRWQNRGGAVGNVVQAKQQGHPLTELSQVKEQLRQVIAGYDHLYTKTVEATGKTETLLSMLELSDDKQRVLMETAVDLMGNLWGAIWKRQQEMRDFLPQEQEKIAAYPTTKTLRYGIANLESFGLFRLQLTSTETNLFTKGLPK